MTFDCPKCGKEVRVDREQARDEIVCPSCGANIRYSDKEIYSGKIIAGFELQDLLGVGGMGEVWLAYQESMDRRVALKILSPYLAEDKSFVDNFLREVKLAAKLEHPNIVSAFDAGVEDGIYYFAMTYVPGETFAARIARENQLPEHELLKVALHVSQALQYAWNKFQILHRDVNPANIMLTPDGDIKLMDMGISKNMAEDDGKIEESLVGTPNYISPEQVRGKEILDIRSDMYSLGATLYHLATGRIPFESDDPYTVLDRQLKEDPAQVRDLNPSISHPLAVLIETMMAKDRGQRPASWELLIADVQLVIKGEYPHTPHPTHGRFSVPSTDTQEIQRRQVKVSSDHLKKAHDGQVGKLAHPRNKSLLPPVVFLLTLIALAGFLALQLIDKNETRQQELKQPVEGVTPPNSQTNRKRPSLGAEEKSHEQLLEDSQMAWEAANSYVRRNPQAYDQAIARFRGLADIAGDTKYKAMAESKTLELQHKKEVDIKEVLQSLKKRASAYLNDNQYMKAASIYADYDGLLAKSTKSLREKLATKYREKAEDMKRRKEKEHLLGKKQLRNLLSDIVPDICEGNLKEVIMKCQAFKQRPLVEKVEEKVESIQSHIRDIGKVDEYVAVSLREDKGKEIKLTISGQEKPVRIQSVSGRTVSAEVKKGLGYAHFTFSLRQIPFDERYERLKGQMDPIARELYAGIYYYKTKMHEKSLEHFKQTDIFSEFAVEYLETKLSEVEESRAQRGFVHIMKSGGINCNLGDMNWAGIASQLNRGGITPKRADYIGNRLDGYLDEFADSSFVQSQRNSIDKLMTNLVEIAKREDKTESFASRSPRPNANEEHRFYEPIRKARRASGRKLYCNPLGKDNGIIPEIVEEELQHKMILVLQAGDYKNRDIELTRLNDITIEAEEGVRSCSIKFNECDDVKIRNVSISSLEFRNSNFVLVDSHVSSLKVQRSSPGVAHNSRIYFVQCSAELTMDHCLVGVIAAAESDEIVFRNSILYGKHLYLSDRNYESVACIQIYLKDAPEITFRNSIIYTPEVAGYGYVESWRLEGAGQKPSPGGRTFTRFEDLDEYSNIENSEFVDPEFMGSKERDYRLKHNSPAKRAAMSGKDIGPDPDLDPLPF